MTDNEHLVSVRRICEEQGLNERRSELRLKRAGINTQIAKCKGRDGKPYRMTCVTKDQIPDVIKALHTYVRGPYRRRAS